MAIPEAERSGYGKQVYARYELFLRLLPDMIREARLAASVKAHSYRDFRVGAAVLAVIPHTDEHGIAAAGNLKRAEKSKVCAEKTILARVTKAGYTRALGLVVSAITDVAKIEAVTGRLSPTLHPCTDCLHLLDDSPLIRKNMLVVSVGQDTDVYQAHSLEQLQALYGRGSAAAPENPLVHGFTSIDEAARRYAMLVGIENSMQLMQQKHPAVLTLEALGSAAV